MNLRDLYVRAIGDLVEQLGTVDGAVAVASAWFYNPTQPNRSNRNMLRNAVAISMRRITGAYMACQPDGTVAMQESDRDQIVNDINCYSRLRKEIIYDRAIVHFGTPQSAWIPSGDEGPNQ